MKEQYVTFEMAELAYLKGLPTFLNNGNDLSCYEIKTKRFIYYHVHIDFPSKEKFLYAPTQSLLQKWLREEHKIHIEIDLDTDDYFYILKPYKYIIDIYQDTDHKFCKGLIDSYEEALEQGLQEALKLI